MSHLKPVYAIWDHNAEAMASDIGEPGVKVRQWRNRGNIPPAYWQRIIDAAWRCKRKRLDLSQFIPPANDQRTHDATSAIDDDPPGWALTDHEINSILAPRQVRGERSGARVIVCDVCERRVDGEIPNTCTFVDCPHAQRIAA